MKTEELIAALEPISDLVGEGSDDLPDDTPVMVHIGRRTTNYSLTLADLRRVESALAALERRKSA